LYSSFQLVKKYISYLITAENGKGHGIHSPFAFQFVKQVLNAPSKDPYFERVELLRKKILKDHTVLEIEDYGAGSVKGLKKQRRVSAIARTSLKNPKYAQMLFRLVQFSGARNIIELGTSLGITTAYLAKASGQIEVHSFEGAPALVKMARSNFESLGLENIRVVSGAFDESLPVFFKEQLCDPDLIYIDGHHTYEATLRYFKYFLPMMNEHTVMVFDDIHWSEGMEIAWKEICADPSVTLTIDLFFMGIVFFSKSHLIPQHFTIRF
jgi:predicted O-methyltransferase YrrM